MHNLKYWRRIEKEGALLKSTNFLKVLIQLSQLHKGGSMAKAFFIGLFYNLKALFDVRKCSLVIYVIERG